MKHAKRRVQWADYWFSAKAAGVRSPQLRLRQAIKAGTAKRIGWGRYEFKVKLPPSWHRSA